MAKELAEIRDYDESRSVGLGADFVNEFEMQVLRIASMPERWVIVRADVRRYLMKHEKRHTSYGTRRR